MRAAVGLDRYGALREYYDDQRNNSSLSDAQRKRYDAYYNILDTQYNYDTAWKPGTDRSSDQTVGNIFDIRCASLHIFVIHRSK